MNRLLLILAAIMTLVACEDNKNQSKALKLTSGSLETTVFADATSVEGISFEAYQDWKTHSNADWIEGGDPQEGKACSLPVSIKLKKNLTGEERTGNFFIEYVDSEDSIMLTITQKPSTETGEDYAPKIPDAAFKKYLTDNFDSDADGYMSYEELEAINSISISNPEIKSVEGIGYCKSLEFLTVLNTYIPTFNFSEFELLSSFNLCNPYSNSIRIEAPQIKHLALEKIASDKTIDIGRCHNVTNLHLMEVTPDIISLHQLSELKSLSITNTKAENLNIAIFKLFEELNIDNSEIGNLTLNNPFLKNFRFNNSNTPSIDLSCSNGYRDIKITGKNYIENLNLSNASMPVDVFPETVGIDCVKLYITSENFTLTSQYTNIKLFGTAVKNLDITGCAKASELILSELPTGESQQPIEGGIVVKANNTLKTVTLLPSAINNLNTIQCSGVTDMRIITIAENFVLSAANTLENLTIGGTYDNVSNTKKVAIASNSGVKELTFGGFDKLTTFDISPFPNLKKATVRDCPMLAELNASGCSKMEVLYCQKNALTSLLLSGCSSLKSLECDDNQLTTLDVSMCDIIQDSMWQPRYFPLQCRMDSLKTLYLKTGWKVNGINFNRSAAYIHPDTEILYK